MYALIEELHLKDGFPLAGLCATLDVSRSGFYGWRSETESPQQRQDQRLMRRIREIFVRHRRRYGARRIAIELQETGTSCGVDRVARLMKIQGLKAIGPKSFKPRTTESRHALGYSPNLLWERETPKTIDEVWVGDITYLSLRSPARFAYLAILMDLCSRRIVGWELSEEMTEELVLSALRGAVRSRQPPVGLIHHSDRGGQYAGNKYRGLLRRAGVRQSMSRAGNCYDNAFLESCFGTIKTELEMTEYESREAARREIAGYIAYYNHDRRHSALDYQTPHQFERQMISRK